MGKKAAATFVAMATLSTSACGLFASSEKSWEQEINAEVSDMNIILGTPQKSPVFEFSLGHPHPYFLVTLCMGATDDSRVQEKAWNSFLGETLKYGPADSYKLEFSQGGEVIDDKPFTTVKLRVNLKKGADEKVAQDVARKVIGVMRRTSPCK